MILDKKHFSTIWMKIKEIIEYTKSSNIASRLVSGAFWSVIGKIFGSGFVLLAFIVVARIIGAEKYGELGMVRSTIIMFSGFAGAGMGLTAARHIALYRNTNQVKTYEAYLLSHYFSVGFGILISLLLYFFAPMIADKSLKTPYLANNIRLGTLAMFFMVLNNAQNGALQGFERFKSIAVNTLIQGIVQALLLIIGAYYLGIAGVIGGIAIAAFLLWGLNYRAIRMDIPKGSLKSVTISKDTISVLYKFSLPAAMSSILVVPLFWWCKTFVVQKAGFEAMANYDVAEQWNFIILFIPATLSGIIIPILTNTLIKGTIQQYQKIVMVNILINAMISVFATLGICLLAVFILKSYGRGFNDITTFRILIISTIPNAIANVLGQIIASKGKMWIGFSLNFLWVIWILLFTLLFVGRLGYGALGLALAMLCAYILHVITSYAYVWKRITKFNN